MKTLTVGDKVPSFNLLDQNGNIFSIREQLGKTKIVVYFYPKDESAVCTKEACAFRDSFTEFTDAGITVIGINSGTVSSHFSFANRNRLPFKLLSDPDDKVLKQFGIKPWLFLTGRETFLINKDGKIDYSYRAFLSGEKHSENVLKFLRSK